MALQSGSSPCAACKFLRRKCLPDQCVFAPYFPPEEPQKFVIVHKIFGACNVNKLLKELPVEYREDAVNSLAYEAEARMRDPVYGCVGIISTLQQKLLYLQHEITLYNTAIANCTSAAFANDRALHALPYSAVVQEAQQHYPGPYGMGAGMRTTNSSEYVAALAHNQEVMSSATRVLMRERLMRDDVLQLAKESHLFKNQQHLIEPSYMRKQEGQTPHVQSLLSRDPLLLKDIYMQKPAF